MAPSLSRGFYLSEGLWKVYEISITIIKMDVEFIERVTKKRDKVDELFTFEGQKIGRGTYGHVYKAKRRGGCV